jgi:hypothetical protein
MTTTTVQDIIDAGRVHANTEGVTVSAEALAGVAEGAIFAQQGDLYFARVTALPAGVHPWPFAHGQLAPGTTQGSRHMVDLAQVRLWLLPAPTPLQGPLIEAPTGCVITHPEHGAHIYPAGIYAVTFQRAYATEVRRIVD